MAKQGQHQNDANDKTKSKGPNHPDKSTTITTGTYKKRETYEKQAREHKNPEPVAQRERSDWNEDVRDEVTVAGSTRERDPRSGRSGSDSDADRGSKGH